MQIWSAEIKELESLNTSLEGRFPELEKELERLVKADDDNMVLLYSRRCLEVIITDLCEHELKRPRKTEPLKGIIDKLLHEEKVPGHIITSMHGLNDLSNYGTHPKEFEPEQVKPVLNNLTTIIKWFVKYKGVDSDISKTIKAEQRIKLDNKANSIPVTVPASESESGSGSASRSEPGSGPSSLPGSEHKTGNIFHNLWKRGVPQITAGYFIATWIIIRFLDWILARYDFSTKWADVTLIILLAMIPSVLLYIYNRERINHGKLSLIEKITFPFNIVITILLVLLLSRSTALNAMTETVTVVNEFGAKENRKIFKENYITKLAIFPFINESKDSSHNWLQYGIYRALYEDLLQFNYVSLGANDNALSRQEQIKYAKTNNYPHFITGTFRINNNMYEITSRIYQTSNGSILKERIFMGSDFFSLIDSVSLQARKDVGILKTILNSFTDLPFTEYFTDNWDAFRYYTKGLLIDSFEYNLNKAVETDTTFALALYSLANRFYNQQFSHISAIRYINQAMRQRQKLTEYREFSIRELYYYIHGQNDKAIALAEMQYELKPDNIQLLRALINAYRKNLMIDKAEKAVLQLNALVPDHPDYMILLAESYLYNEKHEKGLEILEKILKDDPENISALMQMAKIYIHQNNFDAAELVINKTVLLKPEEEKNWLKLLDHIAYSRNNQVSQFFLEPYTGNYRSEVFEFNTTFSIHNNHLLGKAENQQSFFCYPVSDKQFVIVAEGSDYSIFVLFTFIINTQGKVIKVISEQNKNITEQWKEDSLILEAKELLDIGKTAEALPSFQRAYDQNPEHYYLANFIRHLEFIQSQEYEKLKPVFDMYLGEYENEKLYREKDKIYYKDQYYDL
jgi:tetratricopeptide (TPR) repeat protein